MLIVGGDIGLREGAGVCIEECRYHMNEKKAFKL